MDWDETKETFQDRPDVPADEKLTADEWNNHVTDQKNHAGRHEDGGSDEVDVSGLSGVLADAQTPQTEAVQDIVGALIQANGNITTTYDDANDTLTIDTTALNEEEVEDAVAALVTAGNAITVNYDDANDALSIAVDESALSFYDGTNLTANVDNESVSTTTLTVDGDDGVGVPDTSTVMSLEFGSWTTADANRPVILKIEVESETDGVSDGVVNVRVDENGDTTEDYKLFTFADSRVGNAFKEIDTFLLVLPAEGQFQIENVSDPNSNNNIRKVRKFTL